MAIIDFLKKIVDPVGPVGEVISPADVYKTRLGLPTSAPHVQRAELETTAQIERTLAPARFVAVEDALEVPISRQRQVSAFVAERWAPVYAKTTSVDPIAILRASETLMGWQVTQHVHAAHCDCTHAKFELDADGRLVHSACGRARKPVTAEQFAEILATMQIEATDEFYNGIYETIPGNDPIILDGEILRGEATYDAEGRMTHDGIVRGTMITKGRREYNERTKGFVHWDKGFIKERLVAQAEEDSRPMRNVRRALEATAGEVLPMWRPVGINMRRDRRSAV